MEEAGRQQMLGGWRHHKAAWPSKNHERKWTTPFWKLFSTLASLGPAWVEHPIWLLKSPIIFRTSQVALKCFHLWSTRAFFTLYKSFSLHFLRLATKKGLNKEPGPYLQRLFWTFSRSLLVANRFGVTFVKEGKQPKRFVKNSLSAEAF